MPPLGTLGETESRDAPGTGNWASFPDDGERDRPVAGRQPIGSDGYGSAGSAQRGGAGGCGRSPAGIGDGRAKNVRAGQATRSIKASRRGGTHGLGSPAEQARQSSQQAIDGALGPLGMDTEFPGVPRLDRFAGVRSLGPGPVFQRLSQDARQVAELAGDLAEEMHEP